MTADKFEEGLRERGEIARRRGVMSGSEFISRVKAWAAKPDENEMPEPCLVTGAEGEQDELSLRGLHCAKPLRLRGFCFLSTLDLRDARIDGPLVLSGSTFLTDLRLSGARIEGSLDIRKCWIAGPDENRIDTEAGALDLRSAVIDGPVHGERLRIQGSLAANNLRVSGDCNLFGSASSDGRQSFRSGAIVLRGSRIEGQLSLALSGSVGEIDLQSASVDADILLYEPFLDAESVDVAELNAFGATVGGDIFLRGVAFAGPVSIGGAEIGRLWLNSCSLTGGLYARNLKAGAVYITDGSLGSVDFGSINVRHDFIARPAKSSCCKIQDLNAVNAEVGGFCVLDAVQCSGNIDLSKARLGFLRLRSYPAHVGDDNNMVVEPTAARSIKAHNIVVNGDIELYGISIGCDSDDKDPRLDCATGPQSPNSSSNIDIKESSTELSAIPAGVIDFKNAEIRGDLRFWSDEMAWEIAETAIKANRLQVDGLIDRTSREEFVDGFAESLRYSEIARALLCDGSEVRGDLVLTGLCVGTGKLQGNPASGLIDLADAEIRRNVDTRPPAHKAAGSVRTRCRTLSLRGMTCTGDLYLQALSIDTPIEEQDRVERQERGNAIDGQRVRVEAGGLILCDERVQAELPGQRISLYDGRFSRIVINGTSFDTEPPVDQVVEAAPTWRRLSSAGRVAGAATIVLVIWLLAAIGIAVTQSLPAIVDFATIQEKLISLTGDSALVADLLSEATGTWGGVKWWFLVACSVVLAEMYRKSWRRARSIRGESGDGPLSCELPAFQDIPVTVLSGLSRASAIRVVLGFSIAVAAAARFVLHGTTSAFAVGWVGILFLSAWLAIKYLDAWVALAYTVDAATNGPGGSNQSGRHGSGKYSVVNTSLTTDVYLLSLTLLLIIAQEHWLLVATVWSLIFVPAMLLLWWKHDADPMDNNGSDPMMRPERAPECLSRVESERSRSLELGLTCLAFKDFMQVTSWNRLKALPVEDQKADVNFAQVKVGHLEIAEPIPRLIDFQNLRVERWSLNKTDPGNRYLELLDHASSYNSAIYSQIEQDLRRHGRRELAENVHRAMRKQEQWREHRWLRTALMLMHSLIGYGTHRGPLLGFMLLWFSFTTLWFAIDYPVVLKLNPETQIGLLEIEPESGTPRESVTELRRRLEPLAEHALAQRFGRSIALAVRYHVPIIAWDPWPYLVPRGAVMWFYTSSVMIIHWILWPLLLASLLQTLIPQRDQ